MQKIYIKDFKLCRLQCFSKLATVCFKLMAPASWTSGNALVSAAGGLRFKSRTGQIGHSVTNGSPPLRHSLKGAVLPGRNDAEMGPANSLHASAYYSE